MLFSDAQVEFCSKVRTAPRLVRVRELLDLLVPATGGAGVLQRLGQLETVLKLLLLEAAPSVSEGDLESEVIVATSLGGGSLARLRAEMASDEGQQLEFKSSFSCCLNKYRDVPGLERKHYKRDDVEESALIAIAALMNSDGGVLLIGVDDDGSAIGLAPDLFALGAKNSDKWLQYVRSKISEDFVEGRSVSPYVSFTFLELDGLTIARAVVSPRPKLAFLKIRGRPECPPRIYRRLGNQSPEVKADEIEEFLEGRRRSREYARISGAL